VPMRNCSLYLDERPIVVDGDIVVDEMKVEGVVKA
jgi:2,5-dihydroxypyridine 5,6-dioxygenase